MLSCTGKKNYDALTDDDYFNFVVSLWAEENSEENNPKKNEQKKFHFLCLGALANSKLILINDECHSEVCKFSIDKIGILTKSMMFDHLLPETEVIYHSYKLRGRSKYYRLHVSNFTQN